jgi:hypothetical protein
MQKWVNVFPVLVKNAINHKILSALRVSGANLQGPDGKIPKRNLFPGMKLIYF